MGMNVLVHMRDMKTAAFPMNAMVVRRSFLAAESRAGEALPAGLRRSDLSDDQQQRKSDRGADQVAAAEKSQGDRRDLSIRRHQLRLSRRASAPQGIRNTLDMVAENEIRRSIGTRRSMSMKARSMNWRRTGSLSESLGSNSRSMVSVVSMVPNVEAFISFQTRSSWRI